MDATEIATLDGGGGTPSLAEAASIEGPYYDWSARLKHEESERDTFARLTARYVVEGNTEWARRFAQNYAAHDAAVLQIIAWHDEHYDDPCRFIGSELLRG